MNATSTTTTEMTAATVNAACTPATSGAPPEVDDSVITVTNSAVPAAPATCCSVVRIALPCEYRSPGSEPSESVINGVNIMASDVIITVWTITTSQIGETSSSVVIVHNAAHNRMAPGSTSRRAP